MQGELWRQWLQRQLHGARGQLKLSQPAARLHFFLAVLVCLLLPGGSWLGGSGWLAWTMYAHSSTYRVSVAGASTSGEPHFIVPTELAARASADLGTFLAGSERWRHAPVGPSLRRHLSEVAALGCGIAPDLRSIDVTLEERRTLDAPVVRTQARANCAN
jgi:hypothetical protein